LTRIEDSIEINAPPMEVWGMIAHKRLPEWFDLFKRIELTSNEDEKIGATHHMTSELYEIVKIEWDGETTQWIENSMYSWRTIGGPFTGFGSMMLTPIDSKTKFTIVMDYEIPNSYLGKILDRLIIHEALKSEFREGLRELKNLLEKN
jgi:uncharacterized membrane protein